MFHAGFLTDDGGWDSRLIHEQEDNFKRLAELIVEECARELDERTVFVRGIRAGTWIKQHFEIEE